MIYEERLSLFLLQMANTKIIPGQNRRCPMCTFVARSEEEYKKHVVQCAMRTFNCTYCSYTSNKQINVKRRERRRNLGLIEEPVQLNGRKDNVNESTTRSTSSGKSVEVKDTEQSEEEGLKQDYGDIIEDVSAETVTVVRKMWKRSNQSSKRRLSQKSRWREESFGNRQRLINRMLQKPRILSPKVNLRQSPRQLIVRVARESLLQLMQLYRQTDAKDCHYQTSQEIS